MGIRIVLGQTGNEINRFIMEFARFNFLSVSFNAGYLATIWEKNIVFDFGAGPNFTDFQTAMTFFNGFGLRGEKIFLSQELRYLV